MQYGGSAEKINTNNYNKTKGARRWWRCGKVLEEDGDVERANKISNKTKTGEP